MKKIVYIILGFTGVALGAVGAVLPLLPSVPFLMLAAFCFARSSARLNNWFTNTKLYKQNLESFVHGKGMTSKTKIRIIILVTIVMSFGFFGMLRKGVIAGVIILACVWFSHIIYFVFAVRTISEEDRQRFIEEKNNR